MKFQISNLVVHPLEAGPQLDDGPKLFGDVRSVEAVPRHDQDRLFSVVVLVEQLQGHLRTS